jgi:spore coat protein U-like protein
MSLWKTTRTMAVAAWMAAAAQHTWAVLSCTISASPPTLSGTYASASNLDIQGAFSINCTRAKSDSKSQTLWVGLNQTSAQTMAKAAPYADTLAYGIYSDVGRTALWAGGATGGVSVPLSFGTGTAASATPALYMRANAGQTDKAAGTYSDTLNVTLNLTNSTGQNLANTTLTTQATVPKTCSVSAAAVSYSLSYQAFRTSALIDSSQSVSVSCSKGTQASLSLDKTTGVLLPIGLAYQLGFSPSSSATTAATSTSNAVPLLLGLILTLPAGQAGACGTGICSGSDTRQITIVY